MRADYKKVKAFSLIEVVFALGIFASVVVGIYGLLAIALSSVKSVINESICNNFQASIIGLWDVAPRHLRTSSDPAAKIVIPNFGDITLFGDKVFYLTDRGTITDDLTKAVIKVDYKTNRVNGLVMLQVKYLWPPEAPDSSLTRREISMISGFAE